MEQKEFSQVSSSADGGELSEQELDQVTGGCSCCVGGSCDAGLTGVHEMLDRMDRLSKEAAGPEPLSREERLAQFMEEVTQLRDQGPEQSAAQSAGNLILPGTPQ